MEAADHRPGSTGVRIGTRRDSASAERERARIESALRARMYIIDRETFELFAKALGSAPYSQPLLARADTVTAELWPRWQATPSGRALAGRPDHAFASVWRPSTAESVAIVAPIDALMEQAVAVASRLSTTIALEDSHGRHIWGPLGSEGSTTIPLSKIGLPARLRLWLTNQTREP